MPLRKTPFAVGEYYHLYSRGVDKRVIFLDTSDEKRFIRLLYLCNGSKPIDYRSVKKLPLIDVERGEELAGIGAYCLMPNHFHLLVRETKENGITTFMRKLMTAYSVYFNKKYQRTGRLFSSEFKSSHLENDTYLKYIYSYIHMNPLKLSNPKWPSIRLSPGEVKKLLNEYENSSYLDYVGNGREESLILDKLVFPEYFAQTKDFERDLISWFEESNANNVSYPHLTKERPQ